MALSRTPGPEGLWKDSQGIDPGTLARTLSPTPGPIGLHVHPDVLKGSPQTAAPHLGIAVHQESKIKASEWVKKIKGSDDVPDYFKDQINSKGDLIFVTNPKKFKVPTNVISKDWLSDWLSAFMVAEWELTTGSLDMSVKKGDSAGPFITVVHNPDLSKGETIDGFTKQVALTQKGRSTKSITIDFGITLPDGVKLNSGRKLIVVANRIALSLEDKIKMFDFDDSELLATWFHEIACHAGRNSLKKPDTHGDKEVERSASDIEAMIPNGKTVSKVLGEIQGFLNIKP
jgi:hypothetical protein